MNFEAAKNSYRKNAVVQKVMAEKLTALLVEKCGHSYDVIFEIGSGTGFLTDEIYERLNFTNLILNDMTDNFTGRMPNKYIKGDINKVNLPAALDLILSNAVFQWVIDYDLLFSRLRSALKKGGILAFSTFGKKNFSQIKDITGFGLNYPDLKDFMKNAGFKILYIEEELQTMYFKDVKEILRHIKLTGVRTEQNKIWSKKDFKNFEEMYLEKYSDNMGFELTYHPVYYIAQC